MKNVPHYPSALDLRCRAVTYRQREKQSAEERADKALDSLLGTELDQGCLSEQLACLVSFTWLLKRCQLTADIGHDVVANDERSGHEEPHEALENVVDDEVTADDDEEQGDVNPAEEGELLSQILLVQIAHKSDESCIISFALERIGLWSLPTT
jgi:hypothetical protein